MRWLRSHIVAVAGLLVLAYLLIPNLIVIIFSFNKPAGNYNYQWQQFSTRRLDKPVRCPRHL